MRKSNLLIAGASALLLAACSGKKTAMNDDMKKDLEMASTSDELALANQATSSTMVVSPIEQTTPPAKKQAPSAPVRHHKPAPKSPPQVVQAKAPATVTETQPQQVATAPASEPAPVSPRPTPVQVSYPGGSSSGGDEGRVSTGSTAGAVIGTILGAVIRGGIVMGDGDNCDPRTERGHGRMQPNNPYPFPLPQGIGRVMGSGRTRMGTYPTGMPSSRLPGRR